jgi:hypothetical protein
MRNVATPMSDNLMKMNRCFQKNARVHSPWLVLKGPKTIHLETKNENWIPHSWNVIIPN